MSTPVVIRSGSALTVKLKPNAVTITHRAKDILLINHIGKTPMGKSGGVCYVLIMRDPRELVVEQNAQGCYIKGFDRQLRIAENGIPTYSDPGILQIQNYIDKAARSRARTIVLRPEDIENRPDLVGHALLGVTGIPLRKSFAALVAEDRDWLDASDAEFTENRQFEQVHAERIVRQFRLAPELFSILDRWGYARERERGWFDALAQKAPAGANDEPGIIVGFYSEGTLYEMEARRLAASIEKLGLPLHLEAIPATNDWLAAVRQKPLVLQNLREKLRGPLLYVDVDAVVHSNPWPYLRGYIGDIAVAGHRDEQIISGTLLLNDTMGAKALIEAWIAAQANDPSAWDQHALQAVVLSPELDSSYHVDFLPPEMCKVFDRRYNPPVDPVIEHLQASREHHAVSGDPALVEMLARRHVRIAEIEGTELATANCLSQLIAPKLNPRWADLPEAERRRSTETLTESRATDFKRWADARNLKSNWSLRAQMVGGLLAPGDTVLDIGCGAMDLEHTLPKGAFYIPADIVMRDDRTLHCDLNSLILPDESADVVTMLGVIEYCHDPAAVFGSIAQRWPKMILTYNPVDLDDGRDRKLHGWLSHLTSAELVEAACSHGFQLEFILPYQTRERIYSFSKACL